MPYKEKLVTVRASEVDFETIRNLQQELNLPNQQAVVNRLIASHQQKIDVAKELLKAKTQIDQKESSIKQLEEQNNQLQQEKKRMEAIATQLENQVKQLQEEKGTTGVTQPQQIIIDSTELEAFLDRIVEQKLQKALSRISTQAQRQAQPAQVSSSSTKASPPAKEKELISWESKSNHELWETKAQGAASEKVRRSFEAICLYNDTLATGDNDRLALTNQALRELSGVNGLAVGDWIKAHTDEIISYNSKYGMQNKKDISKVETYYNKRHGEKGVTKILSVVNENFLDGAGPKSASEVGEQVKQEVD